MNDQPVQHALAVFRDACELPRGERDAYLATACGQDLELRARVESMLAWDDRESESGGEDEAPDAVRVALESLARRSESASAFADSVPETIGSYRIVRLIAHGGMGVVYEARQENPARRVAIKVGRVGGPTGERARRFELEAQLLARLRHPGIAQIIEAGTTSAEAGAQPFFVMEFVEGQSLTDYASSHLHSADEKLQLMVRVCDPVAFAHSQGVVHRDLKPDNVLLEVGGTPKVLDFGVAKVEAAGGFGAATMRTEAGRVIGTLGYMAPEQLGGTTDGLGPSADVYSLGVMIYELLTGRLPHDLSDATLTRALAVVTTTDAPLLGVVRPEYRGDIEALVAKSLEKDPRHRYADAAALQGDLERYLRGEPILARPAGPLRRITKWTKRNPALATAGFGLVFALATAASVLLVKNQEVRTALAEFELLADSKRLERAIAEAELVYPARPDNVPGIEQWLRDHGGLANRLADYRATLASIRSRAEAPSGETWAFADPRQQLKHDVLARLVADLEVFDSEAGLAKTMVGRLALATRIHQDTIVARQADWDAAVARVMGNAQYGGLVLEPQVGLVPLGEDPDSHLEEFLHFETHEGPIPPAGNGARSTLGFDGNTPGPDTGIVFVLIPGGTYWMGAQNQDPNERNYDSLMTPPEEMAKTPVHEVTVAPFLLSKYEMTGGQWKRFVGANPSAFKAPRKPVTMVSWTDGSRIMGRLGLVLPSEQQWEYAARAGVRENPPPWWTGADVASLQGMENVFDQTLVSRWGETSGEVPAPFHDEKKQQRLAAGNRGPAPVGTYAANGFGLYDIGGNVTEWCSDAFGTSGYFCRGGNHKRGPVWARSTARIPVQVAMAMDELGLRPARRIERKRPR